MDDKLTVIDGAGSVQGKLNGRDARVLGRFDGELELAGKLQIGEGADVKAKVQADTAEIAGTYSGELHAKTVVLLEKAKVSGSIVTETLAVREGAQVDATISCGGRGKPGAAASRPPAPAGGAPGPGAV